MARCPVCAQRVLDRAVPHASDVDEAAAHLWASYIHYLLSEYPAAFAAAVIGRVARALAEGEG